MPRTREEQVARRDLHDPAEVHHRHTIAEELNCRQIMCDEEAREAHVALEVAEQVENRGLHRDVECGDRLVGDQHLRLDGEGACNPDALALSARELVRVAKAKLGQKAAEVEQLCDARIERPAAGEPVQAQRLTDDLPCRQARVEGRIGVLKDHVHVSTMRPELASRKRA